MCDFRETATGGLRFQIESPQGGVHAAAFSADGQRLASAGNDGAVLVWDVSRPPR